MNKKLPVRVVEILLQEAKANRVTIEDILSGIQIAAVVNARRDTAIRLRASGMSLHQIGRYLGSTTLQFWQCLNIKPVQTRREVDADSRAL